MNHRIKYRVISLLLVLAMACSMTMFAVCDAEAPALGDVDGDGQITAVDALEVLQFSVRKIEHFSHLQGKGNVNGDGDVNVADALEILQYSVGKIMRFSGEAAPETLIVYFSRSGNTELLAEMIREQTGGDFIKLETAQDYPADYNAILNQAQAELAADARPALRTVIDNIDDYDVVFVGYPIWWGTTPMAVLTFLESADFSGKTVIPFCTSGSSSPQTSFQRVRAAVPGATVPDGYWTPGASAANAQPELSAWLDSLKLFD